MRNIREDMKTMEEVKMGKLESFSNGIVEEIEGRKIGGRKLLKD